jgi:hypothetical protein
MLKVRTVPVIKLLAFLGVVFLAQGCSKCDSNGITGRISDNGYQGVFHIAPARKTNSADPGKMELHVNLEKKALDRSNESGILAAFEEPSNWRVTVNGKDITPELSFPELSNTMSPEVTLVLPFHLDPSYWKRRKNSLAVVFDSEVGSFTAPASENDIACYLKNQQK